MAISFSGFKFLIIDSEAQAVNAITLGLTLRWPECRVNTVAHGTEGIELVGTELPHLVVTEVELPDIDGFEVIYRIRLFSDVPIIVLTTCKDELCAVKALELGADDYILKPPSPLDFLARLRAALRRCSVIPIDHEDLPPYTGDKLVIEFATRQVFVNGDFIHLSPLEYSILCQLVRSETRVVDIDALRRGLYGAQNCASTEAVRKSICQLRQKLVDCSDSCMIVNERGIGYRFLGPRHTHHQNEHEIRPDLVSASGSGHLRR